MHSPLACTHSLQSMKGQTTPRHVCNGTATHTQGWDKPTQQQLAFCAAASRLTDHQVEMRQMLHKATSLELGPGEGDRAPRNNYCSLKGETCHCLTAPHSLPGAAITAPMLCPSPGTPPLLAVMHLGKSRISSCTPTIPYTQTQPLGACIMLLHIGLSSTLQQGKIKRTFFG